MHVWAWARVVAAAVPSFDFGLVSETCAPLEGEAAQSFGQVSKARYGYVVTQSQGCAGGLASRVGFAGYRFICRRTARSDRPSRARSRPCRRKTAESAARPPGSYRVARENHARRAGP